ncbi:MAG TPA: anion transporter [Acetobacteraceae bacterium]|nr:anion transporter [Acetobacteraceae bacterium]
MIFRWLLPLGGLIGVGLLLLLAFGTAALPWIMPQEDLAGRRLAAIGIFVASYLALAIGKVPGLSIDRAGVALVGACLMVASGAISLDDAWRAVDPGTITLLLGMMIIVANLRISGFFALVTSWVARRIHGPVLLLGAIIVVSGVFSAFLVNDAICLVMAPLVLDLTLSLRRNPVPYLLAVAMASNVGSAATITGNPQNMMIGSFSAIPYQEFTAALAPVAVLGLLLTFALLAVVHRKNLRADTYRTRVPRLRIHRVLVLRSICAAALTVALFFAGQPPAKVAIVVGALLLLTRRIKSTRVYTEIDWSLLLMFTGLFIIVAGAQQQLLTPQTIQSVGALHLQSAPVLSLVTAILSNLVSNVPAVLVLKPFVTALPAPERAWLVVAMASTLAGNLTVLGSIANLIVVEKAARRGVMIGFWDYFRIGAPLTVLTLIVGTLWLMLR